MIFPRIPRWFKEECSWRGLRVEMEHYDQNRILLRIVNTRKLSETQYSGRANPCFTGIFGEDEFSCDKFWIIYRNLNFEENAKKLHKAAYEGSIREYQERVSDEKKLRRDFVDQSIAPNKFIGKANFDLASGVYA